MDQESPSFWADIKKYEDTLEKDPNSYCFAPLSELYRKLGMIDDAISIAKRGCELHPEYVGGYMALGRGYLEKGLNSEAREALEKVVRVTPENLLAQRILSKIYLDAGDNPAAEASLKAILSQNPDDPESRMLLDSLVRTASSSNPVPDESTIAQWGVNTETASIPDHESAPYEEPEEIIDLDGCEIIEEEIEGEEVPATGEDDAIPEFDLGDLAPDEEPGSEPTPQEKDPLTTVTLAELYLKQGFPKKALSIFRELSEEDPGNLELKNRILALKREIDEDEEKARERSREADYPFGGDDIEAVHEGPEDSLIVDGPVDMAEAIHGSPHAGPVVQEVDLEEMIVSGPEPISGDYTDVMPVEAPPQLDLQIDLPGGVTHAVKEEDRVVSDEQVVRALEIWLENIKRRR